MRNLININDKHHQFSGIVNNILNQEQNQRPAEYDRAPSLTEEDFENLSAEEDFLVYDSGRSQSDVVYGSGNDLYVQAYQLFKGYPEWIAKLNANPWTYFHVPLSLFDGLGLSNKANDKIAAYQQNYNTYISNLIASFFDWKNSLPESQREQLTDAGYNADLANVSASSVSSPQTEATDPASLASGSTGQEVVSLVSSVCSVVASGVSSFLAFASTLSSLALARSQRKGLDLQNDSRQLSNFQQSRDLAKLLYGAKGGSDVESLDSVPQAVKDAYASGAVDRDFEISRLRQSQEESAASTDWMSQVMKYENVKDLFGDEDYWRGTYKIAQDAYRQSIQKYKDFLEAYDSVSSARSQNGYNSYVEKFYAGLDAETASLLANEQNNLAFDSLRLQALAIKRNLAIFQNDWQQVEKHFKTLTDPNASKFAKMNASMVLSIGGAVDRILIPTKDAMTPVPSNTSAGTPVSFGLGSQPHPLF